MHTNFQNVNDFEQMQYYSMPNSKNDENEAVAALRSLQHFSYSQPHPNIRVIHTMPPQAFHSNRVKDAAPERHHASTTKRIIFPILALGLTLGTIVSAYKCAQMCILPYVYVVFGLLQNFVFGDEDGIQCNIWSNSPIQQLQCTVLSFLNGYFISLINRWTRELLTKRWEDSLPTCFAYLFTTCWALYFQYVYIIRRALGNLYSGCFALYRTFYRALDNPMMPFDYIEQNMLMVD